LPAAVVVENVSTVSVWPVKRGAVAASATAPGPVTATAAARAAAVLAVWRAVVRRVAVDGNKMVCLLAWEKKEIG
jgi:hypothetical protein